MDAERFWVKPGVVDGLIEAGFEVVAPDRPTRPGSWAEEVELLATALSARRYAVVAGSNGCSVGVRLAIDRPHLVERLVLCWPATAGDAGVDSLQAEAGSLLDGQTLRGVTDEELTGLTVPVGIIPSDPPNRFHQDITVAALRRLLPSAVLTPGFPEAPRPEFIQHQDAFLATLIALLADSS
jgi:pimeloyl-ACP methyl ester carboxylesterase